MITCILCSILCNTLDIYFARLRSNCVDSVTRHNTNDRKPWPCLLALSGSYPNLPTSPPCFNREVTLTFSINFEVKF